MSAAVVGRAVGILLIGTLLERWQLLAIVADPEPTATMARFVAAVWVVLVVFSATGLLLRRVWAPYLLVVLAVVSTVFHGIPLVPGLVRVASNEFRPTAVLLVNTIAALVGLFLARTLRSPGKGTAR